MFRESWLEADLYWFQGAAASTKAVELFDRLGPLWAREEAARKGLMLCVGWLMDSALCFNGNLDEPIACCNGPKYEMWTYRRLKELVTAICTEADRRGLHPFHVGIMYYGSQNMMVTDALDHNRGRTGREEDIYTYSIQGQWFAQHPEVRDARFQHNTFWYGAPVSVPEEEAVAPEHGQTFGVYFARKVAAMTQAVGLSAVIFRDYALHGGGRTADAAGNRFMDPEIADLWNDGVVQMLTTLKHMRPEIVTVGYSGYYSGMETRRSMGFDLERIARSGALDLWVTQTWCSAFQDFWRADTLGYTPGIMNVLSDMVMLSGTPTGHLFLIEGLDAWEPFESILDFPDKLAWMTWAMSHACVKLPGGKTMHSCGLYASWMNRGSNLIPARSVERLRQMVERASQDLRRDPLPGGPCVIYDRESMEYAVRHPAPFCRGEAYDNWVPMLMKYGVPVLSATRSAWIDQVQADAWIYPMPVCADDSLAQTLRQRAQAGEPVLFMGQCGMYSPAIRNTFSITAHTCRAVAPLPVAGTVQKDLAEEIGTTAVVLNQKERTLEASSHWETLIEALGGPVFAKHRDLPVWIWETPEWGTGHTNLTVVSIPSLQLIWAVAKSFAKKGWGTEQIRWKEERIEFTGDFLFWRYPKEGRLGLLLGNVENGLMGDSKFPLHGSVTLQGFPQVLCVVGPGRSLVTEKGLSMMTGGHGFTMTEIAF